MGTRLTVHLIYILFVIPVFPFGFDDMINLGSDCTSSWSLLACILEPNLLYICAYSHPASRAFAYGLDSCTIHCLMPSLRITNNMASQASG